MVLPTLLPAAPPGTPSNTVALPRTNQLAGLLTIIRDQKTNRGDFIFYSDRIIRLLVEEGELGCCRCREARQRKRSLIPDCSPFLQD